MRMMEAMRIDSKWIFLMKMRTESQRVKVRLIRILKEREERDATSRDGHSGFD